MYTGMSNLMPQDNTEKVQFESSTEDILEKINKKSSQESLSSRVSTQNLINLHNSPSDLTKDSHSVTAQILPSKLKKDKAYSVNPFKNDEIKKPLPFRRTKHTPSRSISETTSQQQMLLKDYVSPSKSATGLQRTQTQSLGTPGAHKYLTSLKRKEIRQWQKDYATTINTNNQPNKSRPPLALDNLQQFSQKLRSFLNKEETVENLAEFIASVAQKEPSVCALILESLLIKMSTCAPSIKDLMITLVEETVQKFKSNHILLYQQTLKGIADLGGCDLYILIHSCIKKAYAEELIHFYLHQNENLRENALFSHCWYLSTDYFIKALCEKAQQNPNDASTLLQAAYKLLKASHYYSLSASSIPDLFQTFKALPNHENLKEVKHKLLQALHPHFTSPSLHLANLEKNLLLSISQKEEQEALKHSHALIESVYENKITKSMIDNFAWDLKKIDAYFFSLIQPTEFIAYKKNLKTDEAPHIKNYIQHYNTLTYFVVSSILSSSNPKIRARWCTFFIKVASQSAKLGSLNIVSSLVNGLENSSVEHLHLTWKEVDKSTLKEKNKLKEIFSLGNESKKVYKEYILKKENKNCHESSKECLIPVFPHYLSYFTFIDENPSLSHEGHLNANKINLLAQQHQSVQKYQDYIWKFESELLDNNYSYNVDFFFEKEADKIEKRLGGVDKSLNELDKISKKLEPHSPRPNS